MSKKNPIAQFSSFHLKFHISTLNLFQSPCVLPLYLTVSPHHRRCPTTSFPSRLRGVLLRGRNGRPHFSATLALFPPIRASVAAPNAALSAAHSSSRSAHASPAALAPVVALAPRMHAEFAMPPWCSARSSCCLAPSPGIVRAAPPHVAVAAPVEPGSRRSRADARPPRLPDTRQPACARRRRRRIAARVHPRRLSASAHVRPLAARGGPASESVVWPRVARTLSVWY